MSVTLHCGDCLDIMPTLPAGSVDAIITDLPYGTTQCAWDEVIPFKEMWEAVKRVLKPGGVFVTTASQPFTSKLVMSNMDWFKYDIVWKKVRVTGHLDAKRKPLREHESILVFCDGQPTYNPQMKTGKMHNRGPFSNHKRGHSAVYGAYVDDTSRQYESNQFFPRSIVEVQSVMQPDHPSQKPVALYEYLIRTYTNPGETVLDIAAGSGTTGEAAHLTGRDAILIEKDPVYFEIMKQRIAKVQRQPLLFGDGASAGMG